MMAKSLLNKYQGLQCALKGPGNVIHNTKIRSTHRKNMSDHPLCKLISLVKVKNNLLAFFLVIGLASYSIAQIPEVTVRFASPQFDCVNDTYCLDVCVLNHSLKRNECCTNDGRYFTYDFFEWNSSELNDHHSKFEVR